MKRTLSLLAVLLVLLSCNKRNFLDKALDKAGDNRKELEKVLNRYNQTPKDSLKYKAAVFLIENMCHHSYKSSLNQFAEAFDSIANHPYNRERLHVFFALLDSISKKTKSPQIKIFNDIESLSSEFIINNIELAFKAWYRIPKDKRASFDEFCNYILPYRSTDEPIEFNAREKLMKKYSWVYNYIDKGASLRFIVDSINSQLVFKLSPHIKEHYKLPLSTSQFEKCKIATCDDAVNYLVNVFRAIGIISARDRVPQWGNHHKLGHSWIYTKYGDEDYSTSTSGSDNLKERYKNESIPKVNRSSYAYQDSLSLLPLTKDVTHKYVQTLNPSIENVFDVPISQPIICIFNRKRTWNPIDTGIFDPNKNTVSYKNIGSNVLYLAATIEDKTLTPINNPFFIDNNQNIHFFKPTEHIQDSVIITRKYGASSPRYTKKRDWATSLDGSCFMASNDLNFKNADTLFKITKHNSTHAKKVVSLTKKKYKYLEFKSKKGVSNIIQMLFQDKNNTQLNATFIEKNGEDLSQNNTSFSGVFKYYESTFSNFKIKFDKKVSIDNAIIQTRNDGNHIMIGNKYQLFYWDKEWQSLGVKKANDTVLYYNTPKNALLRLRFIGDGYEEHVFTIDENKKQKWLGFHNQ